MDEKMQMREDFAAAVRACRIYARPWKIATGILSTAVIILTIVAIVK